MMSSGFGLNSAEVIGHNEDLLIDILLKLSTRSLIQFMLVSKQWLSIISNPRFCLAHTRSLHAKGVPKPSALFLGDFHYSASGFRFLPLSPDCVRLPSFDFDGVYKIKLLQSCNGLLLCYTYNSSMKGYLICNPVTRKFKMLPVPISSPRNYRLIGFSLAFDPLKSPHHKIISVWGQIKWDRWARRQYFIDIYSSETNSWIASKINFTLNCDINFELGVFFKGAIHWDGMLPESLYLDVENECLKTTRMPKVHHVGDRYFGESGGYLHLAVAHIPFVYGFSIFAMVEDHSYWYLKYSLEYDILSPKYFSEPFQLFCVVGSDEDDSIFVVCGDGRAVSYSCRDGRIKQLHHCPRSHSNNIHLSNCFRGCQYIETLACIL